MRQILPSILMAALISLSCTKKPDPIVYPTIEFEMQTAERTDGIPSDSTKDGAIIRIAWPDITAADKDTVKVLLNQYIYCFLLDQFGDSACQTTLEYQMDTFINEYKKFIGFVPDSKQSWEDRKTVAVLTDTLGVFSIGLSSFSYTGGAHPNSTTYFANFNAFTGDYIRLDDVFIEGYKDKLAAVGNLLFRKQIGLTPDDDLEKAGYWFPEGQFALNDNYLITDRSLIFFFNSYEIAPYSMGPAKLIIPYDTIKKLFRSDSPCAPFLPKQ